VQTLEKQGPVCGILMLMKIPRLIIAAPMSGSGKTTLTTGLLAALVAQGLRVAPFKVGPDYIDPTYHALAAKRPCHNLDAWMLAPPQVQQLFARHAQGADLALIEGVMGLFDGFGDSEASGSTAHLARLLQTPVLLVLDIRAMAQTAAALVKGLSTFDSNVKIAGIVLNRAGSLRHAQIIKEAIENNVGLPVVGHLLRDDNSHLPERHLGLIPTLEAGNWADWLAQITAKITSQLDLSKILELAKAASPLLVEPISWPTVGQALQKVVIAVARDAAFNFTYEDNLDLLRAAGAEIVFFSPLTSHALPQNTQLLYLSGGFPELYAAQLASNSELCQAIRTSWAAGLPIYAECGGLMYLTEQISDLQGQEYPMLGVLPGRSVMTKRLTMGYRVAQALQDSWLWQVGETVRGHEFHYSSWEDRPPNLPFAYELSRDGSQTCVEGGQIGQVFASYLHLHFLAYPALVQRMIRAAQNFQT